MNSIDLSGKKRIVIKVGTSTLTHKTGLPNLKRLAKFVEVLSDIKNSGRDILLVTSGAIAVGVGRLGLKERPKEMAGKQACAAIGQCWLMQIYDELFTKYNHNVAQLLLTRDVIQHEERKANVVNTILKLLDFGVIPIINENDTVSTEEITSGEHELTFRENDVLSAIVAVLSEADLLILMSDVDGLYDSNPAENENAKIIPLIREITDETLSYSYGKGGEMASGGMATKLQAAKTAQKAGIETLILQGSNPNILYKVFENKAKGTLITDRSK